MLKSTDRTVVPPNQTILFRQERAICWIRMAWHRTNNTCGTDAVSPLRGSVVEEFSFLGLTPQANILSPPCGLLWRGCLFGTRIVLSALRASPLEAGSWSFYILLSCNGGSRAGWLRRSQSHLPISWNRYAALSSTSPRGALTPSTPRGLTVSTACSRLGGKCGDGLLIDWSSF